MSRRHYQQPDSPLKTRVFEIIFLADSPAGKAFDIALLVLIVTSVLTVALESVVNLKLRYHDVFYALEWAFTLFFMAEYIVRLWCVKEPMSYARSFFGIIDLIAFLPGLFALVFSGLQVFAVVRLLRLLRIFRILKLTEYMREGSVLWSAVVASQRKIQVFLLSVFSITTIFGTALYAIEGPTHGFDDIPTSVYWAIVTLTTVGYGDIAPGTLAGKLIAATLMLMGFGIIAVPTGIVTSELNRQTQLRKQPNPASPQCSVCGEDEHAHDAHYCRVCGSRLEETDIPS